jgi:hypothetical protein
VPDLEPIAAEFAALRERRTALITQAQAWTGGQGPDELGTFDNSAPVDGDQIGSIYARLVALSVQRLRVLSDQLAASYAAHAERALVMETKAYNRETEELEVTGEQITALAQLEGKERDRLERLLTVAVRLQLESRSVAAIANHGLRTAALAQSLCEQAGLDWADADTRRLAQRAIVDAEARVVKQQQSR